ncbi:hypothetical protein THASP1DRAFT_28922, partial [Thamnocephalis sphaerospora]
MTIESIQRPGWAANFIATATDSNRQQGLLKCYVDKNVYTREIDFLQAVSKTPKVPGTSSNAQSAFAKLYNAYPMADGRHFCTFTELISGDILWNFAMERGLEEKDRDLPGLYVEIISAIKYMHGIKWVHGDIQPKNIIIRNNAPKGASRVSITGFYASQKLNGEVAGLVIPATLGYEPPEDYTDVSKLSFTDFNRKNWMIGIGEAPKGSSGLSSANQFKRDAWM